MEQKKGKGLTVGLLGNPNCGKTTLFNALTGSRVKVANWPGVTVERMEGQLVHQQVPITLVDLPGVYSLDTGSMEEQVSADWLNTGEPDVIINVINSTALERNLYLTMQLVGKGIPVVAALNLMDVAKRQGTRMDTDILRTELGLAGAVPVSARKRTGLDELLDAVVRAGESERKSQKGRYKREKNNRNENIWSVRTAEKNTKKSGGNAARWPESGRVDYQQIEKIAAKSVSGGQKRHQSTDRADRLLIHPIWGIPVFFLLMAAVFTLTFVAGDWMKGYLELGLELVMKAGQQLFLQFQISDWVSSLVFDGIFTGVGGILTFLPNLLILYLSMALLEDSGYMARAAYVMNETMAGLGMTGKAFLPLILGFGCTVPAAAATGALESREEKRKVLRLLPFMSCSAKLPIYGLFAGVFFGRYALFVTYVLCAAGAVLGLVLSGIAEKKRGERMDRGEYGSRPQLLIELPNYRLPDGRTVWNNVWEKVKDYLNRAGTVIFVASMLLWFMMGYGPAGVAGTVDQSFAAWLGKGIAPLFAPAGFGIWQLCVALICGLSAKEVVVSATLVLFQAEGGSGLGEVLKMAGLTPAGALAFLVFCLLYSPCAAALAAIKKESGSGMWTASLAVTQTVLAWCAAAAVYLVCGRLING